MKKRAVLAAALTVMAAACEGGSGSGPAGVDRSKQVSAVSDADKSALCDWFAPMVGGYGAAAPCTLGGVSAPPDKATCVAEFPVCAVSVGQFQDCIVAIIAAQNTCTNDALAMAAAKPECAAAAGCFN